MLDTEEMGKAILMKQKVSGYKRVLCLPACCKRYSDAQTSLHVGCCLTQLRRRRDCGWKALTLSCPQQTEYTGLDGHLRDQ